LTARPRQYPQQAPVAAGARSQRAGAARRPPGRPPDRGARVACLDAGPGRRQRRVREFLGLSQEQLARLAGVSQRALSRL